MDIAVDRNRDLRYDIAVLDRDIAVLDRDMNVLVYEIGNTIEMHTFHRFYHADHALAAQSDLRVESTA